MAESYTKKILFVLEVLISKKKVLVVRNQKPKGFENQAQSRYIGWGGLVYAVELMEGHSCYLGRLVPCFLKVFEVVEAFSGRLMN